MFVTFIVVLGRPLLLNDIVTIQYWGKGSG